MKKCSILLAAVLVMMAVLSGCGGGDASAEITKTAAEIADEVFSSVTFKDSLIALDADMYKNYYRIQAEDLDDYKVYLSGTWSTAEEIAVFKAASADKIDGIKAAIDTRLADLTLAFENYVPGEITKINDPTIVTKGNFVILVLSDDPDAAQKKVNDILK